MDPDPCVYFSGFNPHLAMEEFELFPGNPTIDRLSQLDQFDHQDYDQQGAESIVCSWKCIHQVLQHPGW